MKSATTDTLNQQESFRLQKFHVTSIYIIIDGIMYTVLSNRKPEILTERTTNILLKK